MDQPKDLEPSRATPGQGLGRPIGGCSGELVRFHVRDITNSRAAGEFESEYVALASLKGGPDGHFSVNNHRGAWCEVEVRGGERFVRHALMVGGNHAAYTNIDS
jgi:hypothetical protein